MITVNNQQSVQLSDADNQFIEYINNMITAFGQIPYTVPQKLIVEIIKNSARYFYRHHWRAQERAYFRVTKADLDDYYTTNNIPRINGKIGGFIKLAPNIQVVKEIYKTNNPAKPTSQELIENIQLLQRSSPYGMSIMGINNSLYIIEACCKMVEEQNFDSIFGTSLVFNYNPLTHVLQIGSELNLFTIGAQEDATQYSLILDCLVNVDIQVLYNDDLFIRHVIARTKEQLKRVLGGHTIELPGGVTLNPDEICNNIEDAGTVEELLKNAGGIGDLILMR